MCSATPRRDRHADVTLGDLLYADRTTPVPETHWVELVRAMAGGDQQALQALYDRTHRLVFTLIMRITGNRETAEELTLDVFHDAWRRAKAYDPAGGPVVGWIMNQARSRAIDRLRYEGRKKRVDSGTPGAVPAPAPDGPEGTLGLRERSRVLRSALTVLTPDERTAIEVAFFSEVTYVEAAARLDLPVGTVKTRIRSALGKLRQALPRSEATP